MHALGPREGSFSTSLLPTEGQRRASTHGTEGTGHDVMEPHTLLRQRPLGAVPTGPSQLETRHGRDSPRAGGGPAGGRSPPAAQCRAGRSGRTRSHGDVDADRARGYQAAQRPFL